MGARTIQELGQENETNLCKSCCHEYPTCDADDIIFGNGVGNDNICACSNYEAISWRSPADRGAI